jgi:hypothetical protein
MENRNGPYAFLVKRQTFTKYSMKKVEPNLQKIDREVSLLSHMSAISCLVWLNFFFLAQFFFLYVLGDRLL